MREMRGRVMSFAYLPVNLGSMVGPAIGAVVTRSTIFAVFPAAAGTMALGVVMGCISKFWPSGVDCG